MSAVEWTNPHGWIHVDVEEKGETITYDLELPSPSTLMRQGWRRNDLKVGDKVVVKRLEDFEGRLGPTGTNYCRPRMKWVNAGSD